MPRPAYHQRPSAEKLELARRWKYLCPKVLHYLHEKQISTAEFCRQIKAPYRSAYRWFAGEFIPTTEMLNTIVKHTGIQEEP